MIALTGSLQGQGMAIVDAGGGTIDISTYKRVSNAGKATFEEIAVPQCEIFEFSSLCDTILTSV
jgi:hypothetical protein